MSQHYSSSTDLWHALAPLFDAAQPASALLERALGLLLNETGAVCGAIAPAIDGPDETSPLRAGQVRWQTANDAFDIAEGGGDESASQTCRSVLSALVVSLSQSDSIVDRDGVLGLRLRGPSQKLVGWATLAFDGEVPSHAFELAAPLCQMLGSAIAAERSRQRLDQTTAEFAAREAALHEREMRCRMLLEQGADALFLHKDAGLWDWNLATNVVEFSPTWKRQLGYSDDEIPNNYAAWESRVHPDDLPTALERIEHVIRGRSSDYYAEFRMRHRDGSWRWIEARGVLRRNSNDDTSSMFGTHFDVTDKKCAEAALWRQNYVLEQVAAGLPLADALGEIVKLVEEQMAGTLCSILLLDEAGLRLRHGAAHSLPAEYVSMVDGVPVGPRVGSCGTAAHFAQTVVASDISSDPLWDDYRDLALSHGLRACWSMPIVERLEAEPGTKKRVLGTFAIYRKETGAPSGYDMQVAAQAAHLAAMAIQRDRSDREMEKNKRFIERIASASPDIIYVLDQVLHTTDYVNRRMGGDLGYCDEELPPLHDASFCQIMHPDDVPRFQSRIAQLEASAHDAVVETDFRLRDVSGNWHWVLARESVFTRTQTGRIKKIVGSAQYVTVRKHAEEQLGAGHAQLLHASRLATMGQMVAALSHEIAQPLSAIGNFAAACRRMMEKSSPGPLGAGSAHAVREHIESIVKQSDRCGAILSRLRAFARRTAPTHILCDVESLLRESVDLVAHELRGRQVKIDIIPADELPRVGGDPVQLQQVIVNLLTNARDAVCHLPAEDRRIAIRAYAEGKLVAFAIDDRGPGVSHEAVPHLFDAFHTTKSDGMGMGLSICQTIVRDHGGTIDFSTNEHGGARFCVTLPAAD